MVTTSSRGATRFVFLTRNYAFKIPRLNYGWANFLQGLLANMQERKFALTDWPELCPVTFSIPGGWLVIMPRVREMTQQEFDSYDMANWVNHPGYVIPAEMKADSFGWYHCRLVAIDYGN